MLLQNILNIYIIYIDTFDHVLTFNNLTATVNLTLSLKTKKKHLK